MTAKTDPEKAQFFAESVERNFGIESHLFRKSHFDRVNKFEEAHSYHVTPLDSTQRQLNRHRCSDSVADVHLGIDNVYNGILNKAIVAGFYKHLA